MARHERDFCASTDSPLSLDDLLALLRPDAENERSREDAIACFLSGGDGWRDAMKQLGGAFAEETAELRDRKRD